MVSAPEPPAGADALRATVLRVLGTIAPEADLAALPDDAELAVELDLDSINFLDFVVGLHEATGVDVPERDYPRLTTLGDCVAYLAAR